MNDLEGAITQVEGDEATPAGEGKEPTQGTEEPTVRTQKEFDTALGKGLASTNAQLSLQKQATETAKAEAEQYKTSVETIETELHTLQEQHDELAQKQYEGDDEGRRAFVDRRAIAEDKRTLAKEKVTVENQLLDAKKLALSAVLSTKADALVKETGIEISELGVCKTEEEMEVKALRFKMNKEPAKVEETPQFDKSIPSGSGLPANPTTEQIENMTDAQYYKLASERYKEKK